MKGLYIMAFCALIALSLITLTEADGYPVGLKVHTRHPFCIGRRDAPEEVTKRGWLRRKWDNFRNSTKKKVKALLRRLLCKSKKLG
ncbi:hypothetical protein PoB_002631200 [Plakobranchus ocellatus]|uniref:Uncharacterized protein n=1 Tax=Plakobranchus ocellatus TaxID=259542 RepID=A0AAV3ZYN8_9GAST|nr:hypothetical protein PoB_002631200 [Plakobranchus ocellatus]